MEQALKIVPTKQSTGKTNIVGFLPQRSGRKAANGETIAPPTNNMATLSEYVAVENPKSSISASHLQHLRLHLRN